MKDFSYPEEACEALLHAYAAIAADKKRCGELEGLKKSYADDKNCDFAILFEKMDVLCGEADIARETGRLLLLICLSERLKDYYAEAGLAEEIWHTSMQDLKWKMIECKQVHGMWGTASAEFQSRFFQMKRFGFGRLQFNLQELGANYEKDGLILKPETEVIAVHIPRTGTRLDRESCTASYRQAADFYKRFFPDKPVVFTCHSWLLFPKNKEVLSTQSNLYAFMSDYDIIERGEYEDYSQVWRLFDRKYNGDVKSLPQDTSLRRAYADWIRKGEKTGWGYGMYVYKD